MATFNASHSVNMLGLRYEHLTPEWLNYGGAMYESSTLSDTYIEFSSGDDDEGERMDVQGTFAYQDDGFEITSVTGSVTGISTSWWYHDYETVPEEYYSGGWSISGMELSVGFMQKASNLAITKRIFQYADQIAGSSEADALYGFSGDDHIDAGDGHDVLDGGLGADTLMGAGGDDAYVVDNARDIVAEFVNEGVDTVSSYVTWELGTSLEHLTLLGNQNINGAGNRFANVITGNSGSNRLEGGDGIDTVIGGSGNDFYVVRLTSDGLEDTVVEQGPATDVDTVRITQTAAFASRFELVAPRNIEVVDASRTGFSLIDLRGNASDNVIVGNEAGNALAGAAGRDALRGGAGEDTLNGGHGADTLSGGTGVDAFMFDSLEGSDRITDFNATDGEKIDVSRLDANSASLGNQAFQFIGRAAFSANATGQIRYVYDSGTGIGTLSGSTDADAMAEFSVQVVGTSFLTLANLVL